MGVIDYGMHLMFTFRGIPCLYYGSEIGKANMRVYILQNATAEEYGANGKIGESLTYLK